ncbi:glycosyl hydrolase [Spirosoma panaciterrae]|uniref:glycosyl hydrolase n=1 Tax=Spirosoma panaciterrae TaxID=496058 RepID=UPI0012F76012|nr:glycosyl hydrolase [Spirosoma panaciterrae]
MLKLVLCIGLFSVHLFSMAQAPRGTFKYGVCGHPLTQEAYSNNIDLQLKILKSINSKFYRIDLPVDPAGHVVNAERLNEIIQKSTKASIKLVPVLVFNKTVYETNSSDAAYKNGLEYGKNFSRTYKRYFDYYEVGNEEDNNLILPQRHGTNVADFDTTKAVYVMAYFKGVCDGIKQEDKSARLIINHTWIHWGFLELLKQYKVNYDIVGCHWYSDMADLQNAGGSFGNVTNHLYQRFAKRIWITEFNIRNGSTYSLKSTDNAWFLRNLRFIRRNKYVDALFIYELFDEPAFANKQSTHYNPGEAVYGLGAWKNKYSLVNQKPILGVYKKFIQQNP